MGDIVNAVADVFGFGPASKQADATTEAASISSQASREAIALQKAQYEQTRADQEPWRAAGVNALGEMQRTAGNVPAAFKFGAGDYTADPGYGFRLSEGRKALASKARARGGAVSGTSLKAMQDYAQESASQEFNNAYNRAFTSYGTDVARENQLYNRKAAMAGIGQTAINQIGAAGTGYANQATQLGMTNAANQGNLALQAGNIRATQYGNYGSALNTALNTDWNKLGQRFGGSNTPVNFGGSGSGTFGEGDY